MKAQEESMNESLLFKCVMYKKIHILCKTNVSTLDTTITVVCLHTVVCFNEFGWA